MQILLYNFLKKSGGKIFWQYDFLHFVVQVFASIMFMDGFSYDLIIIVMMIMGELEWKEEEEKKSLRSP